jgi:hypothetical protein
MTKGKGSISPVKESKEEVVKTKNNRKNRKENELMKVVENQVRSPYASLPTTFSHVPRAKTPSSSRVKLAIAITVGGGKPGTSPGKKGIY